MISNTLSASVLKAFGSRVPRYTSYPTVPEWNNSVSWKETSDTNSNWIEHVSRYVTGIRSQKSIGLYVHLPFCESLCTYCGCNKRITKNHNVEEPYIKSLVEEWKEYTRIPQFQSNIKVSHLHLGGGTPTFFQPDRLKGLIESLKAFGSIDETCQMSFEGHPGNTSVEHLDKLYGVGFDRLSLGIQDFGEYVQFLINRKQSVEDVKRVLSHARAIGYDSVNFDLVYGLPGQTIDSLQRTIELCIEMMPDRIAFYGYAHVPWMHKGQRRYSDKDIPESDVRDVMFDVGKDLFINAGYEFVGMDHFVLKHDSLFKAADEKRMHRDFMGYSDSITDGIIGLGCSAISELGFCYAQNEKAVEAYSDRIAHNGSAVVKGHMLHISEVFTKKLINMIMCTREIQLDKLSLYQLNRYNQNAKKLTELGLTIEEDGVIRILPAGQKYLRSIASVFDPNYDSNQVGYSRAL